MSDNEEEQQMEQTQEEITALISNSVSDNQPEEIPPNTLIVYPEWANMFKSDEVKAFIKQILHETFEVDEYDPEEFMNLVKYLSDRIKKSILEKFQPQRYKIIVQSFVYSGSIIDSAIVFRCLWDKKSDNYAYCSFKKPSFSISIACFAVYLN